MRTFPLTRLFTLASFTLATILTTAVAHASPATTGLGLKKDIIPATQEAAANTTTNASNPAMTMLQILVALGIVYVLLKFALPKLIAKYGKGLTTPADSDIRLNESANFGAGQLQVVTVRGKILLLGVTNTGITTLADLTDAPDPAKSNEPAFFELLDKAKDQPTPNLSSPKAAVYLSEDEELEEDKPAPKTNHKQSKARKVYQETTEQTTKQSNKSTSKADQATDEELDLKARLARLSKLVEEAN